MSPKIEIVEESQLKLFPFSLLCVGFLDIQFNIAVYRVFFSLVLPFDRASNSVFNEPKNSFLINTGGIYFLHLAIVRFSYLLRELNLSNF